MKEKSFKKRLYEDRYMLLLTLPGFVYLLIFRYLPMASIIVAFQKYSFKTGVIGSDWLGFYWFERFFNSVYFSRTIRNTLILSSLNLIATTVLSIILALLVNNVENIRYKKLCQSATYFPHFISSVVLVGILQRLFDQTTGVVNIMIENFGGEKIDFFNSNVWMRPIYVFSYVWSGVGWNSIIYIGAISAVDPSLYEAATIDGCDRLKQIRYIVLPAIKPVIITVLILNTGSLLSVSATRIMLMYQPSTYETMDVISTYVYRTGIESGDYSYGSAVDLFNSIINIILLTTANFISKKSAEVGIF